MRKSFAIICVAFLAGCAVGPDYRRPSLDSPGTWSTADTTFYADSSAALADTAWWHLFGDTVLTRLVTDGLRQNTDIQVAAARVEELMGRYGVAKSDFFPKVDAGATATRGQFGAPGDDIEGGRPTRNHFRVDLSADWEIDLWGRIRRANEAARADLLATEEARRGVVLTTASLIATSYVDLLALDRQLAIARETAASRRQALDLFTQRKEKGDLSVLEYSQAESEYWLAMSQIPAFQKEITFVENNINYLLGRNPAPVARGTVIDSLALPEVPVGMPSTLLERRPDVRFAEEQLRAANARIGVARSLYFPTISLSGMLGTASGDLDALFQEDSGVWDVGGSVFGPIFHWGEIGGEVKAAEGVQKQALYSYVGAVRNAFRETDDALTNRSRTGEQLAAEAGRVEALATYARLARMRYDEGVTDYLEVLDAERSLFSAQLDYTRTRAELYKSVVDIYRALAGGWLDRAAAESFMIEDDIEPRGP